MSLSWVPHWHLRYCDESPSEQVVLGVSSFLIEPMCKWIGSRLVWAVSNFIVFVCMACTAIISVVSISANTQGVQHVIGATRSTQIAALVVFSLLGIPLAVSFFYYSIYFCTC